MNIYINQLKCIKHNMWVICFKYTNALLPYRLFIKIINCIIYVPFLLPYNVKFRGRLNIEILSYQYMDYLRLS